ncbi:MAG: RsmG family class I SAM-dependent methyltransferase, partial [Bilophila sp.]
MAARMVQVSGLEVQEFASRSGFVLTDDVARHLAGYLELLMQWNRVMNLVGTRSWQETFSALVVDSLHLGRFLEKEGIVADTTWDLGAGAGLPGLPLRMIWTQGTFWMVEAREKRAIFLSTVLARFPLPQTHVFRGRAEQFM